MKPVTPFPSHFSNCNLAPIMLFQETIPIITFLVDNFRYHAHLNPSLWFPPSLLHENNWLVLIVCVLPRLPPPNFSSFGYTCSASDVSIHHPLVRFHTNNSVLPLMLYVALGSSSVQVGIEQLTCPFLEMSPLVLLAVTHTKHPRAPQGLLKTLSFQLIDTSWLLFFLHPSFLLPSHYSLLMFQIARSSYVF